MLEANPELLDAIEAKVRAQMEDTPLPATDDDEFEVDDGDDFDLHMDDGSGADA